MEQCRYYKITFYDIPNVIITSLLEAEFIWNTRRGIPSVTYKLWCFREDYYNKHVQITRTGCIAFDVHVTVHRDKFLIIKPTRSTDFSNLFWKETLHVSDSSSVHHQEFLTVNTAMVYVTQFCWQLASCQKTYMTYNIAVFTVENFWWWTEELSETCRVSFQE